MRGWAVGVLVACAALCGAAAVSAAQPRPNIVVIETDDQTAGSMAVMPAVQSQLAAKGTTFTQSLANYSLCCPSRATFLTGQYAHNHGVVSNNYPTGGFRRFQELYRTNNLAVWLHNAGYYTALVGRYLNEYRNQPAVPKGWDDWEALAPDWLKPYNETINDNGTLVHYGEAPKDYSQDVITNRAVGVIDRQAASQQPFFLWVPYSVPHAGGPYSDPNPPSDCNNAPKPPVRYAHAFDSEPLPMSPNFNEADVSDKPAAIQALPQLGDAAIADLTRRYRCELESLLAVNDGVRRIVGALLRDGELGHTYVVFTNDNGFFHGEHRIVYGKGGVYEESIRLPLIMRGPGVPQGQSVSSPVVNADLAPTFVKIAHATAGLTMDGHSLLETIANPTGTRNRNVLVEQPTANADDFRAIRTPRYMYVEWANGERELYDLLHDPYELNSLQANPRYANVLDVLSARLYSLQTCAGTSCRLYAIDPKPTP
jgi:N-acetylglucosamine-6-sulfatase